MSKIPNIVERMDAAERIQKTDEQLIELERVKQRCDQWREVARKLSKDLSDITEKVLGPAEGEQEWADFQDICERADSGSLAAYERLAKEGKLNDQATG